MTTRYHVSAPHPADHLLHVTVHVDDTRGAQQLTLRMPSWIPGSYLLREYARQVQAPRAHDAQGAPLSVRQRDKGSWEIDCAGARACTFSYEVYSHDLNVRANFLDDSFGLFNGVSLLCYVEGRLREPAHLSLSLPEGWRAYTSLTPAQAPHGQLAFSAPDIDALYDCPVAFGTMPCHSFEAAGVPHRAVFCGAQPQVAIDAMLQDIARAVEANAALFGGALPYEDYTFITLMHPGGRGGLEHRASTVLAADPLAMRDGGPGSERDAAGMPQGAYLEFLRLVAHEHFHVWNVKRIRPEVLGPFDYHSENYTRDLWTVEGVTSYYELLALQRAGLLSGAKLLEIMADSVRALEGVPGRALHSLEDASLNAWVKLYRPDEHTRNSSVSYYLKGELVCFALDAALRAATQGERGLDDVLRLLWTRYLEDGRGYPEGGYATIVREATGVDVDALLHSLTRTTEAMDWDALLRGVGLQLKREHSDGKPRPWLGAEITDQGGRAVIKQLRTDSPAARGGLSPSDELVALDGWKITPQRLDALVGAHAPGATVQVHALRRDRLIQRAITLGETPPDRYTIEAMPQQRPEQAAWCRAWLGLTDSEEG